MSNKRPHNQTSTYTADAKARIERTRREGRYQQALELVKQLFKDAPTPDHLELLKDTYLQRALQLHSMGAIRDAATVLEVASRLDDKNRAWIERLAKEMAKCGDATRLQALTDRLAQLPGGAPAPEMGRQLLTAVADAALLQDQTGKNTLPADLRGDFDRVVQAFREVENGQDEAAGKTLAGIGLKSPFLEWKVLLRGFQAFYAHDDDRARENWQRLDPERPPARIAAPFRASIDPPYMKAQTPAVQARLQSQIDSTRGTDLRTQLKAVQKAFDKGKSLAEALRQVEGILPTLRLQAPHLVTRLATAFYWKILDTGPRDIRNFSRVFGRLPFDPHFNLLNARGSELAGDLDHAHRFWQAYQDDIAKTPELWPGEEGPIARALVWVEMAKNADSIPTPEQFKKLPRAIRQLEGPPKPLSPTAEACYRKAIELAPALIEAHSGLFRSMMNAGKEAQAIKAGEELIQQFPHDVETARLLGKLLHLREKYQRACEVWEQVVAMQPLDASARDFFAAACRGRARELAAKKKFDEARPRFQTALDFAGADRRVSVLCTWAAAERLADNAPRADELLAQARERVGELYISYQLLVESHRLGLPAKEKTALAKEFTTKLADPVDTPTALTLVDYATSLVKADVTYFGIKTHVKKIISLVGKIAPFTLDEQQLLLLLRALIGQEAVGRIVPSLYRSGQARFPNNPHFFYLEAVHYMGDDPDEDLRDYKVRTPLEHAARLARLRPADEPGIKEMLADIDRRLALLRALNPFADMFSRMFGGRGGDDFEPDYSLDDFF